MNPPSVDPEDFPGIELPDFTSREAFIVTSAELFGDDPAFLRERWNRGMAYLHRGELGGSGVRGWVAWLLTPREAFVPLERGDSAYAPAALPIGHGQTISAPYMVARMTDALDPGPDHTVLEIGTGSGYQAAMLAPISRRVYTVERIGPLAAEADRRFSMLEGRRPWMDRIHRRRADGYDGWDEAAPFDRIVVTCAVDHVPEALAEQLAPEGVLILPLGKPGIQALTAVRKILTGDGSHRFVARDVYGDGTMVTFVPFVTP